MVLTTRAGEMPNVGHLARTEVTWYGIGVYYWRCVVSRGTHVIARHDDEVFDIEWNYYTHAVEVNITYWENSDNLQYTGTVKPRYNAGRGRKNFEAKNRVIARSAL